MFHFPGCPPMNLWIQFMVTGHYPSRVPPFGDLRIIAHLRLPEAFRSLSRPSSAISALASTLRSCSLDLCSCSFSETRTNASSSQTICLLRLVGTDRSLSLFCLFLCSFQGALKGFSSCSLLFRSWSAGVDSNHRPLAYQASALTC